MMLTAKPIYFVIPEISKLGGSERITSLYANQLRNFTSTFVISIGSSRLVALFAILRILLVSSERGSTVVFVSSSKMGALVSFLMLFKKCYRQKRIYTWEHLPFNNKSTTEKIIVKLFYRLLNGVISVTNYDGAIYSKYNQNVLVVKNICKYKSIHKSKKSTIKYGFVGRLIHNKGVQRLIDLLAILERMQFPICLIVYGDGDCEFVIKNYIKDSNFHEVTHIPHVADLQSIYGSFDILLNLSYFEADPLIAVESRVFGVPMVSFKSGIGIDQSKYPGLQLIPDEDIEEYARRIASTYMWYTQSLLDDLYHGSRAVGIDSFYCHAKSVLLFLNGWSREIIAAKRKFIIKILEPTDISSTYLNGINKNPTNNDKFVPYTMESLLNYFVEKTANDCFFFGIFEADTMGHVGNIKFDMISKEKRSCILSISIWDQNTKGIGLSYKILSKLIFKIAKSLGLCQIELGVSLSNEAAIGLYKKLGFELSSPIQIVPRNTETLIMKKELY